MEGKIKKIKPLEILEETWEVNFETKNGANSALYMGTKKDARKHFKSMNKPGEPMKVGKVKKVAI